MGLNDGDDGDWFHDVSWQFMLNGLANIGFGDVPSGDLSPPAAPAPASDGTFSDAPFWRVASYLRTHHVHVSDTPRILLYGGFLSHRGIPSRTFSIRISHVLNHPSIEVAA